MWIASKLLPKVYGDRQAVDLNAVVEERDPSKVEERVRALADNLGVILPDNLFRKPEEPDDD